MSISNLLFYFLITLCKVNVFCAYYRFGYYTIKNMLKQPNWNHGNYIGCKKEFYINMSLKVKFLEFLLITCKLLYYPKIVLFFILFMYKVSEIVFNYFEIRPSTAVASTCSFDTFAIQRIYLSHTIFLFSVNRELEVL